MTIHTASRKVVGMELHQALRTTGAVRDFTPEPVPDDVVHGVLDAARFAPNGGNRQAWHVIVVRDPATKVALRDLYLPGWYEYLAQRDAGLTPFAPVTDRDAEAAAITHADEYATDPSKAPHAFAERLHESPVLLVVLADLRNLAALDRDLDRYTMVGGASIYPFAWSILLAAHDAGLGGVMTSVAIRREPALRELFHLPDHVAVAAVLALGHPVRRATKLRRSPVETFTTVDTYDGESFTLSP
jgi:nitroreductase